MSTKKNLESKKEKIFKAKDVSKWGLKDTNLRYAQDEINNKETALNMMLPEETKRV